MISRIRRFASLAAVFAVVAVCAVALPATASATHGSSYGTSVDRLEGYKGWAYLPRMCGEPRQGTYRCTAIRTYPAWHWTSSSKWHYFTRQEGTWVYVWPYTRGWVWAWQKDSGWAAMRSHDPVVTTIMI